MKSNKIRLTEKQLLLENEELHRRVYELEETLNSIHNGEIDAIVVSGVDGDNIYSLTSVETKYRIIIEQMYEGAITLTKDGLITYCNARFAELVSEPYERIIGTYFVNLLHESEVPNFLELFKTGLSGKSVGELVYIKNNGHILNLRLSISVLPEVIQNGVCIIFSDITELKRQEEELINLNALLEQKVSERTSDLYKTIEDLVLQQEATIRLSEELVKAKNILEVKNDELVREASERKLAEESLKKSSIRFEALLSQAPFNGVIYKLIRDNSGEIVDWEISAINEMGASSIGLEKAAAIGKRVLALFGEQVMAPYFQVARQVIKTGTPITFESYFEINDRTYLSSVFLLDPDHYANMSIDITDRKHTEEQLAYHSLVLENINDAVIASDENFVITHWNKAAEFTYGWKAEEVLGKHGIQIIQTEFPFTTAKLMRRNIAEIGRWIGEAVQIRKNGSRFPVEVSSIVIRDNDGKISGYVSVNRDITKRKLAEDELLKARKLAEESEIRLRSYFELGLLGMAITSVDKTWIEVNDTICGFLGYTREELMQKTWDDLTHPDDIDVDIKYFDQVLNGEIEGYKIDKRFIRKNGEEIYTELAVRCFRNEENKTSYFLALINDITERKHAEAALRESEYKFKNLVADMQVGVLIHGPKSEIVLSNPKALELLGMTEDQILGKTSLDPGWNVIHEDGSPFPGKTHPVFQAIETLLPVRDVIMGVYNPTIDDRRWLLVGALPQLHNDGTLEHIVVTFNDITKRKHAEEVLKKMEFILNEGQKIAHMGTFEYLADTNSTLWSAEEYSIYGLDPTEPSPTFDVLLANCIHPDDSSLLFKTFTAAIQSSSVYELEHRIIRPDGSVRWVYERAEPNFDQDGKLIRYIGSTLDITERRQAEAEIRQLNETLEQRVIERTGQLNEANKELEAFSYSVSHDLRAPLRAVQGFSNILLDDYRDILDDEGKRLCGIISSGASQMGRLIDDLLNFSRIGRSSMTPAIIDMKSVANSVYWDFTDEDAKKRIVLKVGDLHKVSCDLNLIKIVWNNLIGNAIKYSSKQKTPEISIGSRQEGDHITYFIKDNGVGFNMQYGYKLFGVFQRLHTESEFEGNGVGLAMVQRIISKHAGEVWAESEIGKGATFFFSLPSENTSR
jgi:PAS domain S-box-containing protein